MKRVVKIGRSTKEEPNLENLLKEHGGKGYSVGGEETDAIAFIRGVKRVEREKFPIEEVKEVEGSFQGKSNGREGFTFLLEIEPGPGKTEEVATHLRNSKHVENVYEIENGRFISENTYKAEEELAREEDELSSYSEVITYPEINKFSEKKI